ncbi:MAG TPA: hypothetical protein VK658_19895 [Chryseolinea sp.]|nr:hypothetical protein [Chryseolinea sp.]
MKKIHYLLMVAALTVLSGACDDHGDPQGDIPTTDTQKASIFMRGSWGSAFDASLPFGTTPGVLDDLSLDFRIDDDYYPSDFTASGAPYFFAGTDGTWSWSDETLTLVALQNILPITSITVLDEGNTIRLSFSYEPPDDGGGRTAGTGEYGVSLRKISP